MVVNVRIIPKIEKRDAVDHIEDIVRVSDGIMVARGDLGVEDPIEQVPELQKQIISASNSRAIAVITATQMLESMVNNPSPTRAEVTDVANAIFDGTDAVMLSEETAIGKYPVECIRTLTRIALRAEESMRTKRKCTPPDLPSNQSITEAISAAVAEISTAIHAKAIILRSSQNNAISKISRFRPNAPILAVSGTYAALRRSKIIWGVFPIKSDEKEDRDFTLLSTAEKLVQEKLFRDGDKILLVHDSPKSSGQSGITVNTIELRRSESGPQR